IGLSVALGGTFLVWLLHTSVDWVYNMPGLTGIALLGAAGLCTLAAGRVQPSPARPDLPVAVVPPAPAATPVGTVARSRGSRADPRVLAWTVGVIALVATGAPSLVRQYLAQQHSDAAAAALPAHPEAALRDTRAALRLNGSRVETYYTRASAFARLGDYRDARATLRDAVRIEPVNYVPWVLIGDLATRRGHTGAATAAYARARALDPGDAALFTATPPPTA
ncbi:MAG: hypothetical protein LC720_02935, partial [Actinobacteria bacterium]|nr:hypothetical protein [Actinomycetota bacterium]